MVQGCKCRGSTTRFKSQVMQKICQKHLKESIQSWTDEKKIKFHPTDEMRKIWKRRGTVHDPKLPHHLSNMMGAVLGYFLVQVFSLPEGRKRPTNMQMHLRPVKVSQRTKEESCVLHFKFYVNSVQRPNAINSQHIQYVLTSLDFFSI